MKTKLKHLGKQSKDAITELDLIPWDSGDVVVELHATEFTSHCPVTGQPDFGRLEIRYKPDKHLAETKSVKLYLWQYRDKAEFNEVLVAKISHDLFKQVAPWWVEVVGHFNTRGGIGVSATSRRSR